MKKELVVITSILVAIIFIHATNVSAITYESLTDNNQTILFNTLIDEREYQKEIKEYLRNIYGDNYIQVLAQNQRSTQRAQRIESSFEKNEKGEIIYPSYIGGIYIDENNNLTIQVVASNLDENSRNYIPSDVNVEYVSYSYAQLEQVHNKILDYFMNENESEDILGLYIDTQSNHVIVELKNYNYESVEKFKTTVIDSPLVSFVQGQQFESIADVTAGAGYTSSVGKGCSYGYRAKNSSGVSGIVTAAHCFNGIGDTIPGVGTVQKRQYGGSIDAAWVQTYSGVNPTNTLAYRPPFGTNTTITSNVVLSFFGGQKIAKAGVSTGYSSGTVVSTSYSAVVDGVSFTNLVRANLNATNGDSGGIVMTEPTLLNGNLDTAGIAIAVNQSGSTLIAKASEINAIFGLSRY